MLSKLVCRLFGHQPLTTSGWQGGTGYAEARRSTVDGVGTLHLYLYAECPRCREVYPICNVHVPAAASRIRFATLTPPQETHDETLARECDRLAGKCDEAASEYGTDTDGWHGARSCAELMRDEAAAHRAKKVVK